MRKYIPQLLLCILLQQAVAHAQDKSPVKYGKVAPEDFTLSAGGLDSNTDAIVIADIGRSSFQGNTKGWFTIEFRHYKRVKIINKNGFDAATVSIPLYFSGTTTEKLVSLKASTYNLENGKVVETKLDDKSVFTDKISKNKMEKKFTLPALKEGSIIEYSYIQNSDFLFNLQPWSFQGGYPCLWSEYEVDMPNFFQYVTLYSGYLNFNINTTNGHRTAFTGTEPSSGGGRDEHFNFEDDVNDHRWVIKNVPALKPESFTTTPYNYLARLEFQLSRYSFPNSIPEDRMGNWVTASQTLMKSDEFGADVTRNNGWLDDDMKVITQGATSPQQKAQKIYAYVRDNFTCTESSGMYASSPLKTVFKNKNGNVAEMNLLLTAMLRHEKITADPVILSTRANGFTNEIYPLLDRFNYVVSRAVIDSATFYLDASQRWMGFGHLPGKCYNGHARLINSETPSPVYLSADSMTESKMTFVIITNEGKGAMAGHLQSKEGYLESATVRERVQAKGQAEFLKSLQTAYPAEMALSNLTIDSLKITDLPVTVGYDVKVSLDGNSDLVYFNPMLSEGYKENPFKSAERKYPVEMPSATDEIFTLNMDIPEGYDVDEMPKSAKVKFNEDDGFFEYLIQKSNDAIQFRSRIKLNKANFTPEDYSTLRDFFGFIVKKQSEQIVFKKKK